MSGWADVCWEMPLERVPEVVALDHNVHFDDPEDRFCLPGLWSLHAYRYEADLEIGGTVFPVREGYVGVTPPGAETVYRYKAKVSPHFYVHFRFGDGGSGGTRAIRAIQDAGDAFEGIYQGLSEVVTYRGSEPRRVNARVWDILWQLYELQGGGRRQGPEHPAVRKAVELIDRHLHTALRVSDLAEEGRVSYSYLGKLFEAEFGVSVKGYIQRRRWERARHLLENTTVPIKTVAAWVGLGDLQHFNKFVRGQVGVSPREVRVRARNG